MPALCTPGPEAIARRLLIAFVVQAAVAGCSRPRGTERDGIHIGMYVTPQPASEGIAHVELMVRDAAGRPIAVREVELEANMSHAGMKPSFAIARPNEHGQWLADLQLTMPGDWVVLVRATLEDGREIERTLELPGVVSR